MSATARVESDRTPDHRLRGRHARSGGAGQDRASARPHIRRHWLLLFPQHRRERRGARRRVRRVPPVPRARRCGEARAEDERRASRLHGAEYVGDRDIVGGARDAAELQRIADDHARGRARRSALGRSRCRGRTSGRICRASATAIVAYEAAMRGFCQWLLRPMALALGLARGLVRADFVHPTTFVRLLHYPPQPPDAPDDAFGSAPHTDYGFITVLAQDNSGGLEVRRRDGTWLKAHPVARHLGRQCRRHALALDQRPLAIDAAPREEPLRRRPFFDPVFLRHATWTASSPACRHASAPARRRDIRPSAMATI